MLGRTFVIAAALVLLLAPAASAQQQVTDTRMIYSSEAGQTDPTEGIERGGSSFMFVRVDFCHGGPGLNPNEGGLTAAIELGPMPEWITLSPPTETFSWAPPQVHPSQDEACLGQEEWQLNFKIAPDAPFGEQGTVDVKVIVTPDADMGTYKAPAELEWTASIPVAVKAQEVDPITGEPLGGGGAEGEGEAPDPEVDTKAEESPVPAPIMGILALVGLAALGRRRD